MMSFDSLYSIPLVDFTLDLLDFSCCYPYSICFIIKIIVESNQVLLLNLQPLFVDSFLPEINM